MQKINISKNQVMAAMVAFVFSAIMLLIPHGTVDATSYTSGSPYTYNMFNWFYGPNPNDPNYGKYVKAGLLKQRTLNNYSSMLPQQKPVVKEKILYWDRPVTFYGVPPSPTHGASAITPPPPGLRNVYYDDLAPAAGPLYVSGSNYGNGRPVGRVIDTNGGRAIVPGGITY